MTYIVFHEPPLYKGGGYTRPDLRSRLHIKSAHAGEKNRRSIYPGMDAAEYMENLEVYGVTRVRIYEGTDHFVTEIASKTESEQHQIWIGESLGREWTTNDEEGPLCEGVHTRYIERPSAACGQ